MAKHVTYHSPEGPRVLTVLSENADGTLNLGTPGAGEDGKDVLEIGKCSVSEVPITGSCTLDAEKSAEKKSHGHK